MYIALTDECTFHSSTLQVSNHSIHRLGPLTCGGWTRTGCDNGCRASDIGDAEGDRGCEVKPGAVIDFRRKGTRRTLHFYLGVEHGFVSVDGEQNGRCRTHILLELTEPCLVNRGYPFSG